MGIIKLLFRNNWNKIINFEWTLYRSILASHCYGCLSHGDEWHITNFMLCCCSSTTIPRTAEFCGHRSFAKCLPKMVDILLTIFSITFFINSCVLFIKFSLNYIHMITVATKLLISVVRLQTSEQFFRCEPEFIWTRSRTAGETSCQCTHCTRFHNAHGLRTYGNEFMWGEARAKTLTYY